MVKTQQVEGTVDRQKRQLFAETPLDLGAQLLADARPMFTGIHHTRRRFHAHSNVAQKLWRQIGVFALPVGERKHVGRLVQAAEITVQLLNLIVVCQQQRNLKPRVYIKYRQQLLRHLLQP